MTPVRNEGWSGQFHRPLNAVATHSPPIAVIDGNVTSKLA